MRRSVLFGCSFLALSCAAAPPKLATTNKPSPVVTTPDVPSTPPNVGTRWAAKTPSAPVIDGDIAEWSDAKALPTAASPLLAFALGSTSAFFVVDLAAPVVKDGLWIGLAAPHKEPPPLGEATRIGTFEPFSCKPFEAEPQSAEAKACFAIEARRAEFLLAFDAHFERRYYLDHKTIRVLGPKGLETSPNAVVASKSTPRGTTLEVALPLAALPRMGEIPVRALRLHAEFGAELVPPSVSSQGWPEVKADPPVTFPLYEDLRKKLQTDYPLGFSYQPGEPNKVEIFPVPGMGEYYANEPVQAIVWEPVTKLGDVELGYVRTNYRTFLGIYKASKFVACVELDALPKGFAQRDGVVHFFMYDGFKSEETGPVTANWQVKSVNAAGVVADVLEGHEHASFKEAEPFHSPDFDTFGIRGRPWAGGDDKPGARLEITWKLDAGGMYRPQYRKITGKK